jgi:hypothetical protein
LHWHPIAIKDVGKLYGHLVYFTAISYILWPLEIFFGRFGIFSPFWYIVPRKIWQPWYVEPSSASASYL